MAGYKEANDALANEVWSMVHTTFCDTHGRQVVDAWYAVQSQCPMCGIGPPTASDLYQQARELVAECFVDVHRFPNAKAVCDTLIDRITAALQAERERIVEIVKDRESMNGTQFYLKYHTNDPVVAITAEPGESNS